MKNVLTKKRHIKIASMILFLFLSTHLTFSQVTLSLKNGTLGNIIQTIKTQTNQTEGRRYKRKKYPGKRVTKQSIATHRRHL